MYVPKQLYTKEILSILRGSIFDKDVRISEEIDDISKEILYSHAIRAFEHDVNVCFSPKSLEHLSDYVLNRDYDYFIDFHHQVKEDCFNHFSQYFDVMINEIIDEDIQEKTWRKSA